MKKKLFISLVIVSTLCAAIGIFNTSYSSVRRNMAIESVNGGESEFILYENTKNRENKIKLLVNVGCAFIGISTISWMFRNKETKK